MEKIFDKNIVKASDSNLNSVLQTNRSLTENSLRMRSMAYLAQVKSSLLTQTIFEVDNDRKQISNYATSLDQKNKLLEDQKRLIEQQKQQIENQKQQLIDRQSKDGKIGYWTIDIESDTITWSDEILRIYDLIGHPNTVNIFTLKQRVHPEDIDKLVLSLERVKKDPKYEHNLIYRVIRNDNSIGWIHCRGKLDVATQKVEGTLQDITELKNIEVDLKEKEKLLLMQSKSAMMGDMISLIAHQFKQPLSGLSMIASNHLASIELNMELPKDQIQHDAEETLKLITYLSDTVDTFRDFLNPDTQKVEANIQEAIRNALQIVNKSLQNNNINITTEYNSSSTIMIIHSELMQVFINLLNNSKDAFKTNKIANKNISIKTFDKDNFINIEISDTAGGIKESILENIFNLYFTTKKEFKGSGLGLYIVKTIIEKHYNGSIEVENIDDGVKFTIKLPV